jgi:glycosyltransferase involved in cell wall biosynthesis
VSAEMIRNAPDLLFVPSHVIPLVHPRSVVTVHDLGYLHEPEAHPASQRRMLNLTTRWNARVASHVIAISETTRQDLVGLNHVPAEKISVIPHGVSSHFRPAPESEIARVRARYGLPERFVFSVGRIQPRKNLGRLARAVAVVRQSYPDLVMVVAGKAGWMSDQVLGEIKASFPGEAFRQLGYVPHPDLPALYSCASVVAMVSTYEGFGLPVLEAMGSGAPVIVSDTPALVEIASDAALVAKATSVTDIAGQIAKVLSEPGLREHMFAAGIDRAADFTWERTARETVAVLAHVLESSSAGRRFRTMDISRQGGAR